MAHVLVACNVQVQFAFVNPTTTVKNIVEVSSVRNHPNVQKLSLQYSYRQVNRSGYVALLAQLRASKVSENITAMSCCV